MTPVDELTLRAAQHALATTRQRADEIDAAYGPGAAAARIAAWERRVEEIRQEMEGTHDGA
jgi:uncharacterized protein YmfQ (DUF2313 family)